MQNGAENLNVQGLTSRNGGRNSIEDALGHIWAEVLRIPPVDRSANFFEIGGDSLKAMEVIARVSDELHFELPLIAFFEDPTIQHLADVLSEGRESTSDKLAKIWADVLHVPQVAADANFFDVGGDSLKAMEVIARVSEAMQVDLPLIAFFEDPTIAHLAEVVYELTAEGTTPPIVRVADRREFPLSYSQQVFWLLEQQNAEAGIYNKPRVFRIHGNVDAAVMERSLNELRQRHEVLRVSFVSGVNGPVQIVDDGGVVDFEVSDLSALEPARAEQVAMKLALETVRRPLDLAAGQVQRARLVQFSDEEFLLCVSEHHVVNDGFTGSILLDELGAIYDAFAAGEPSPLPPLELHYTDFSVWERQWMQGQRLADEIEYWRSSLKGAPTYVNLPTDFAPVAEADRRGNLRSLVLPGELLERIQVFAQSNGTTQFTVITAALRLLLYRWSGESDFLLGTTASNRSRSGTERMPGPFVNPLPLRNPVQVAQTALQLLNSEKKAVMESFAHQDCPFAKIVEAVNPERTTNDNPLFNVGLVMENFPEIKLKGRNFEAEYLNFDPEVSLLDLRFIAVEKHGGLRLSCEYKSALFTAETVDSLLQAYADVLSAIVESAERPIEEFVLPDALVRQAEASAIARRQVVAITATFTAEPIKEPLEFWLQQLGMPRSIEFAMFNQVFQQLLDSSGLLASNVDGTNVILLRMEDLRSTDTDSAIDVAVGLHSSVEELAAAIRVASQRTAASLLLVVGPASEWALSTPELAAAIVREERELLNAVRGLRGLQVVGSVELLDLYPLADYADDYNYTISHIPYQPAMFAALAAMIARRIYTSCHAAAEVIVLDGDSIFGTSAKDTDRTHLEEFLLAQEQASVILAVCSRSDEAELTRRLDKDAGRFGWQNIASMRTGVRAMSKAVGEVAEELGLGVGHCIFVTRDPIDAAEVRTSCPSAVVAELPAEAQTTPDFLKHFWAFDKRPSIGLRDEAPTKPGLLGFVATQLSSADKIAVAVEGSRAVRALSSEAYAVPRSPSEEFLADVWSRLLRVERPSIHDHFFALGGHSLMAAQVVARVRQTLGVELPLRAMFEAPTIAQFAELIEAERRSKTGVVVPPVKRVPREDTLPLSYAQQRLWFIDQLEPGSPAYNISAMYRLRGTLNVSALDRTINEIVRRHESLRTTFHNVDGQPVAVLSPEVLISLTPQQVPGADEQSRKEQLGRLAHQEATTPFDLATGPLVRARLLRISDDDHALLIIVHHIVGDGWSGSLIAGELAALYDAFAHDRPSPLTELEIQYADFAAWQRQWFDGVVRDRQVEYWRHQLAGAPAVLELPADRQRPAVQSHRGDVRTRVIPNELIERLAVLSQEAGATLFMTLLAAFQVLLSRYSGQEDIVVGSSIAGRSYAEIEPLIGFFVNTLPLRIDLSGDPTFRELLARVKQVALDGYAHQDLPFEKLVEELQPERSLSYNPIFQVLFALQNMPRRHFEAADLSVDRSSIHQSTSILDMSWFAFPTPDGLLMRVEFDTDLFDGTTIERMMGHFEQLLKGVLDEPEQHIWQLPLLTADESQQILVTWNDTHQEFPRERSLHQFIEEQVERTPDAPALVFDSQHLSYRELNGRANQLAHWLRMRGVGPDVLVAICAERSVEMVVGLLAIMKAGGAYVPLDPSYPPSRLKVMLEDASPPVLLTQEHLLGVLPEHHTPTLCLDRDWQSVSSESMENAEVVTNGKNLAYLIYTSGSTGKPKGVPNVHQGIVNRLLWMQDAYRLDGSDRVLQKTPYSFDVSVWEFFWPLMTGACLVVARPESHKDPNYLVSLIVEQKISTIHFVPSMLRIFLETEGVERCASLRRVICSGEALPFELQLRFFERLGAELHNLYGPTEAAVDVSYWPCKPDTRLSIVPIGKPIWNTQLYILDPHLNPVPVGVAGELHIGGVNLARGYLKQPELTAQKFIPDPFGRERGARLYKTGDLARFLPDGNVEYLGRTDHQVKLRGFRIELGEIEATLESHASVYQCVVVAREDVPGDKRLVAYVVLNPGSGGESPDTNVIAALRAGLSEKLPEFMVPSAFVIIAAIPLSANGKVNRNALPVPEFSRGDSDTFVGPRNAIETKLAEIWAEVLHLPKVSIHDNFFRVGGHSLLATQVVSRVRTWSHVELPLRAMFEVPTIAELAVRVEHLLATANPLPPIRRVPRDRSLPLSFAQQRLWFLNQLDPNSPYYNIPMALRLSGELDVEALEKALNEIIRRHEVLRTVYVLEGDKPVQIISSELRIGLPVQDLTHVSTELQEAAVRQEALDSGRHVFNLQTGPVIRASLLKLGQQDHVLLLNTHHIANDGWSIWQFGNELAPLYEAFRDHQPSPLSDLPVQYGDFAAWQQSWLQGENLSRQLDYWTRQLAGAPETLELPTDFRRPSVLSLKGTTEKAVFPRELVDRLNDLSRQHGVTLFMTLLAAYQTLLYRYTHQEDIVVGSPIASRNRTEIEDLIGFFVNTLVMRTDLSGNPTFVELLERVRATALGAYSNQDLPFEKLVEALQPERELGRIPLFQVWFVLQNAPKISLRLPGLELRGMDVHNGTAKFDLGLFTVEKPDGLYCSVEYSTDLFEARTIQRFLGHFRVLLEAIVEDPEGHISELPILTEAERQQVVETWNATSHSYPLERPLHQFIEDQADQTPDVSALQFESQKLTYRQLNARANQLAHRLRKMGVGPDRLVAVCAERSVEMVVALLGTIKAGGAYVPIDPDYPTSRLGVMLQDAEPPVLLTQEHLLDVLPVHDIPTLCLDRDWHTLTGEPTDNLPIVTNGKDQAYMIYTSGSTGKPKGVPNVHEGIVNRLLWMQDAYRLDSSDRVMQKTPYSFDVSVWEFFWPLMTGACLVVARPEGHKDPRYLVELIQKQEITTMHFVPSMLRVFLEAEGVERCTSLRRVICSGEALPFDLQQRFFERLGAELHNLYGPTEAAVDVSYWQCLQDTTMTIVPIGKPVWNTQLYILDPSLQPVPVGVPGELHIGGVQLARGYWKQPELTAQKFIADPFSAARGGRLYKTGDLARFLNDGNIEYLGRIDHQVKLRGFRIELGEIEATLDSHPGVMQSVVMAREDDPGDKRLVAYVLPDPEYKGDESEAADALGSEQVSQWTEAFNEAYRRGGGAQEATFNITGWDSSYTGEAIPAEQMRVWVESTVDRIKTLRPKSIWEIGCGTGLLLFRLAPESDRYYGTDISQAALSFLDQQRQRSDLQLPQLTLDRQAAHEFDSGRARGQFDAVVLNSVIQYFPDIEYLMTVLDGAIQSVRPGGAVFVGDVRNLSLLEAFHTSVELFKADDAMSRQEFKRRVQKGIRQEGELLVDPKFFTAIRQMWPQITHVEIQLKRGGFQNELTRFRYDVVLHVAKHASPRMECAWLDWKKQELSRVSLAEILRKTRPEMLGLTAVTNVRLSAEALAIDWLVGDDGAATVGDLRRFIAEHPAATAINPEELWSLENELPYKVEIRPSATPTDGQCDVILRRRNALGEDADYTVAEFPGESDTVRSWSTYANNPLRQRVAAKLVPQLRLYVGGKLPEYMIPSAFVLVDAMPLTGSGKVNRRALPAPEQQLGDVGDYRAPLTPVEEMVAAIFADVLRVERAGLDDNFFDMGGHSLSATQLVSRVRQNLRVDLPVRAVFESPTVAALALAVEKKQRGDTGTIVPPTERVSRDQRLPLSFAQQRLWVLDQIDPNNALYNIPRPLRFSGHLNVSALESALNAIVARHEVLRTTYGSEKGLPFQVIASELKQPFRVIDLRSLPVAEREREAHRLIETEAATPFDLANDSMIRCMLVKLADDDHILLINTHHIADDGWSTGILLREMTELYEAAVNDRSPQLPPLEIQYADYAVWQRNWLQGEVLDRQVAYWRQRLEGAPPLLMIPADRPRPEKPTFRGAMHRSLLPFGLLEAVRALSRQQGSTSFMTLLAGFHAMIFHYTRQPDIVLGTDLANRPTVQTEALIGFFVNLLAVRTDLSGDPTFVELLARVREVALGAYAHQDVPFDKLVEELQPERSLSHNPLVQVLFVQQNTPRSAKPMPGLEMTWFPMDVPSKFDLAVFVSETAKGASNNWVYSCDLFDATTIARMAGMYQLVLEKATINPMVRLSELLDILKEEDHKQLTAQHQEFRQAGSQKLKTAKRKTLS